MFARLHAFDVRCHVAPLLVAKLNMRLLFHSLLVALEHSTIGDFFGTPNCAAVMTAPSSEKKTLIRSGSPHFLLLHKFHSTKYV